MAFCLVASKIEISNQFADDIAKIAKLNQYPLF